VKKFAFWGVIILIGTTIFFISTNLKNENKNDDTSKTIPYIVFDTIPKSISITKTGNPVTKKNISSSDDMDKVISFIKSIPLKEKLNDTYKGWSYSINIEDTNSEVHKISIYSDKVSYDNSFYKTDSDACEKIKKLYDEFNVDEIDPLK
jgi:hypothetical protein